MGKKKNHSQRAHAILGASSSHIWLNCPGAVELWSEVPKSTSEYAEEGTAAHELAEKVLTDAPNAFYYVGRQKFNNYEVTEEMAEHVQLFADYVINARNEVDGELSVEERFDLEWLYPGMFGTNDACIRADFEMLEVIDFKYGAGIPVEVKENSQLIYYALGAAKGGDFPKIKLTIVQPRCEHEDGPIRSWELTHGELMEWAKKIKKGAIRTTKKDAPLNAGDHCRFCNAAPVCPKLAERSIEIAKADFMEPKPKLPEIKSLTDDQVSNIVKHRAMIETFLKKVVSHAEERVKNGEKVKGLKLVNRKRRREWTTTTEDLVEKFGDSIVEQKPLSPAKAEKLFGEDAVKDFWEFNATGTTVAHETDRRRAVTVNAQDDFIDVDFEIQEQITEDDF